MVTAEVVREVSRTAQSARLSGWDLTIDGVMAATTGRDWEPGYMQLTASAANRLATEFNAQRPWATTRAVVALPRGRRPSRAEGKALNRRRRPAPLAIASRPDVIDAEVVDES